MNLLVEYAVKELQTRTAGARQSGLDLHGDYLDKLADERCRQCSDWQERLHQQSREVLFECTEAYCDGEDVKSGLDAISENLPLLSGSRYEGFQKGRIEHLRNYASFLGVTI